MAIVHYLAMTAAEIAVASPLPPKIAWMACHFSPYSTGLSNCPEALPEGSLLILNDRTPIHGHDPEVIGRQLGQCMERFRCPGVLLDFQRPGETETAALAKHLVQTLPCPVGVSGLYAEGLACPVFLPPVPTDVSLGTYLAPWQGRQVWLETALDGQVITLTEDGAAAAALPPSEIREDGFPDPKLHCHYRIAVSDTQARFPLWRTREDLDALLEDAEKLGVSTAVGLYQELGSKYTGESAPAKATEGEML